MTKKTTSTCNPPKKCRTWDFQNVLVIVAHPDDETLWMGGTILMQKNTRWHILTLSRKNDPNRAPKFYRILESYQAQGEMGDLDDGPEQHALANVEIEKNVLWMMPPDDFDLIVTHSPKGEYTRHRRHEEVGTAVINLWYNDKLYSPQLWLFAYDDNQKRQLPKAIRTADTIYPLPKHIWQKKYKLITEIYGFQPDTFEARTTPKSEAFWCLRAKQDCKRFLEI